MKSGIEQRPPGRETFFRCLPTEYDPNTRESIGCAYKFAKAGHAKETRADGSRYFDHTKSVAWIYLQELKGRNPRIIIDGLLHDIVENTFLLSPYRISLNFGNEIAKDIQALTKLPEGMETVEEYLRRIIECGSHAIVVKLCDRLHNLRTLAARSPEDQLKQIEETKKYHLPMLIPALRECGEEWICCADKLEGKINEIITTFYTEPTDKKLVLKEELECQ